MTPDSKAERSPPVRPELAALPGYEPVQPLAELARASGLDEATLLKLDANENPFGPSPKVVEALAAFDGYSVYPDPLQVDLRRAVADYVGAPMERVVAGSGSDELIDLCLRCLVRPGQSILDCPPTFGMYRFSAEVAGIAVVEVERGDDFGIDIDGVRAAVTPETALIIVASPNNPTGNGLPDSDLQALLAIGVPVLLDEAYAEFRGRSAVSWTERQPGLMVLRTFSKWAGARGAPRGLRSLPRARGRGVAEDQAAVQRQRGGGSSRAGVAGGSIDTGSAGPCDRAGTGPATGATARPAVGSGPIRRRRTSSFVRFAEWTAWRSGRHWDDEASLCATSPPRVYATACASPSLVPIRRWLSWSA